MDVESRTGGHAHAHPASAPRGAKPQVAGLNPFLEQWLAKLGPDGPVLDFGCGHGSWMRYMAQRGLRAIGIEPELDRVALAAPDGPVAAADGARIPLRDGSVGVVWCIHVLHHMDDPVDVLAEMRRVLRPGGHIVLAETVEDNPAIRVGRRFHPEWKGTPVLSRFTAATLLRRLDEAGFDVVDRRQHSLVSFAAWALPSAAAKAWTTLARMESRLPRWTDRWGAHLDCVARRR